MDLAFERHPFSGGPWLKFMLKLKKKKSFFFIQKNAKTFRLSVMPKRKQSL